MQVIPTLRSRLAGVLSPRLARGLSRLRGRARADPLDNVAYNRDLWNWYARRWSEDLSFRLQQADVPGATASNLSVLGDEWGTAVDLDEVARSYIDPYVDHGAVVGEIGSGGGRVAARVAPNTKRFYCFDISEGMLEQARRTLAHCDNVEYVLLDGPSLPAELEETFDFLYAFDVFVHLDLHTIWRYVQEMERTLCRGGRALLHTANLTAPGGWESFAAQARYRPETHYFVSPEVMRTLISHTRMQIVKESEADPGNFYLNRDYLAVLRKPV
jgi:SAM-dependent methyltransferase